MISSKRSSPGAQWATRLFRHNVRMCHSIGIESIRMLRLRAARGRTLMSLNVTSTCRRTRARGRVYICVYNLLIRMWRYAHCNYVLCMCWMCVTLNVIHILYIACVFDALPLFNRLLVDASVSSTYTLRLTKTKSKH